MYITSLLLLTNSHNYYVAPTLGEILCSTPSDCKEPCPQGEILCEEGQCFCIHDMTNTNSIFSPRQCLKTSDCTGLCSHGRMQCADGQCRCVDLMEYTNSIFSTKKTIKNCRL